jgi:predicted Fe-Mo cluster-binding NifX family protein
MKIAIASIGKRLTSNVADSFGRADYFIIVDTETKLVVDVLDNSEAKDSSRGSGVNAATLVANSGVVMVFSGRIGPKASKVLEQSLVSHTGGVSGTVAGVLNKVYNLCNK